MSESLNNVPMVLGIAERASYVRDTFVNLGKWNVLGLRRIILTHVVPTMLPSWHLAIAMPVSGQLADHTFFFVDASGRELGYLTVKMEERAAPSSTSSATDLMTPAFIVGRDSYNLFFIPLGETGILVWESGEVNIHWRTISGPIVGTLHFAVVDPPPMDASRIAAIRSDPTAAKFLKVEFRCKKCDSHVKAYTALDRSDQIAAEGYVWYADLPERFHCKCGSTDMGLETMRRNLHGLLGHAMSVNHGQEVALTPLYEVSALSELRNTFAQILLTNPREEELQLMLERNPVLLHQFPAVRIFHKPPILTQFVADFGILTPSKELVLIEIEKANTRLLKKDGGTASELSHAFDQVRSWLHVVDEHRLAFLDQLGIDKREVSTVSAAVIAGRDQGYDALQLRRLKGQDWGRIVLHTYDDLLFALDSLVKRMTAT